MDMQDEYPTDTYHFSPIQRIVIAEIEIGSLLATNVLFGGLVKTTKSVLVIDGHVPGPQKALIWPQHVSSSLSKQAQVYAAATAHYFTPACLKYLSFSPRFPLPAFVLLSCSANFVALRVKETIEQQLLAASARRTGAG
ncbi:hypothetical protein Q7C36_014185 [Tachysurus vachellii]|uniref:Uncharacterized protein n=1 Tax=Tachysurus vachellii TaxID=175792 RepID=A0AA88MFX7_TACVA|nr:hypothetical protein Q7C36_014185 [Tachysurus vachellii]